MKTIFLVCSCSSLVVHVNYAFTTRELAQKYLDDVYTAVEKKYVAVIEVAVDPTDYKVYMKEIRR